jgi:class 3 adenylate cyclase
VLPIAHAIPTLVLSHPESEQVGRFVAGEIPDAVHVVSTTPTLADILPTLEPFLLRAREDWTHRTTQPQRVFATVLFTDLVGSTEKAVELGPRWPELLREHNLRVRRELARYSGREIDTAGDGFFASGFDGPARAIRCACASATRSASSASASGRASTPGSATS